MADQEIVEAVLDAVQSWPKRERYTHSSFTFFVMGSAGRKEHLSGSDQDHGLLFQDDEAQVQGDYLELGRLISMKLLDQGYPLCVGQVMSSNPTWCRSVSGFSEQLAFWLNADQWETLRAVLIFMDARPLVGDPKPLHDLKKEVLAYCAKQPWVLYRLWENTAWLKKGVGLFGQILTETRGTHAGSLNLKETAVFPYVNAVRLLAIKEGVMETSTMDRLHKLSDLWHYAWLRPYCSLYERLLSLRAELKKQGHRDYLPLVRLSREEKKEVKRILLKAAQLYQQTGQWLKRGLKR